MPLAFIVAIIAFIVTITTTILCIYAYSLSDNPSQSDMNMKPLTIKIFSFGTFVSIMIALSHWVHIRW